MNHARSRCPPVGQIRSEPGETRESRKRGEGRGEGKGKGKSEGGGIAWAKVERWKESERERERERIIYRLTTSKQPRAHRGHRARPQHTLLCTRKNITSDPGSVQELLTNRYRQGPPGECAIASRASNRYAPGRTTLTTSSFRLAGFHRLSTRAHFQRPSRTAQNRTRGLTTSHASLLCRPYGRADVGQ